MSIQWACGEEVFEEHITSHYAAVLLRYLFPDAGMIQPSDAHVMAVVVPNGAAVGEWRRGVLALEVEAVTSDGHQIKTSTEVTLEGFNDGLRAVRDEYYT